MTTAADGFQAGIDAVIADNTLNRGGFADAIRTVIDQQFSDADAKLWIDAIAVEYEGLGIINNPTYASLRGELINEGSVIARRLFDALGVSINALTETAEVNRAARIIDLRFERDEVQVSIDRLQVLKGTETKQVKDAIDLGQNQLQAYRQQLRDEIQGLLGDPDA